VAPSPTRLPAQAVLSSKKKKRSGGCTRREDRSFVLGEGSDEEDDEKEEEEEEEVGVGEDGTRGSDQENDDDEEEEEEEEEAAGDLPPVAKKKEKKKRKVDKRKKRSLQHSLWLTVDISKKTVKCRLCTHQRVFHLSNCKSHWTDRHPKEFEQVMLANQRGDDVEATLKTIIEIKQQQGVRSLQESHIVNVLFLGRMDSSRDCVPVRETAHWRCRWFSTTSLRDLASTGRHFYGRWWRWEFSRSSKKRFHLLLTIDYHFRK